jgi:hypothetical protein
MIVISPDIIEPCYMILMAMRKHNRVQLPDVGPKHLIPKVRACVYNYAGISLPDPYRAAEPAVMWVRRRTNSTVAADKRYALGSAGA